MGDPDQIGSSGSSAGDSGGSGGSWTLLTGHGHVLVEIARNPEARIRDISAAVGLTERTVQAIVADLEAAGYITRSRTGRRTGTRSGTTASSATRPGRAPGRPVPRRARRSGREGAHHPGTGQPLRPARFGRQGNPFPLRPG